MSKLNPKLELEKQLSKQIYTALQGEIVEEVLRKTKTSSRDAYWRSSMEGHSLRVQKELLPDVYELCQQVKKKLNFNDLVFFCDQRESSNERDDDCFRFHCIKHIIPGHKCSFVYILPISPLISFNAIIYLFFIWFFNFGVIHNEIK